VITEPELTAERLTNEIFSLLDQPKEIEEMAMKSRSLAYPHAARDIVDLIEEAARRASPKRLGRT
jgi:UDP-N-acetylglucosamine:LPS N-acetylglucosamine transferase